MTELERTRSRRRAREGAVRADASASERGADGAGGSGEPRVPVWLPWALPAVVTLALFREFAFSDRMLLGSDTLSLGYAARAFYAEALRELGAFPLWAPRILGGTPFLEALSGGDALYPPSLALLLLVEPYRALGWKLVMHVFAAGPLMFAWTRALGASRAAALVAGCAYTVTPMLVGFVPPGHDGKLFVMTLAPLLFLAVERFFARPAATGFAAIGLVVALVISTTHFQMAYFLFLSTGAYAAFRSVQVAGKGRASAGALRFGVFLAASLAGAAGAGVQLVPAAAYVTEHSRRIQTTRAEAGETGMAWSSSFSIHPEEAMSLLIPEFAGNDAGGAAWAEDTYWGRNGFKDNHESPGLVVLALASLAFLGGRRRGVRLFMAGLAGTALLFALGSHTPVWRAFYEVVPGIRLFRAPSQAMFLFCFAAVTVAALGVDRLLAGIGGGEEREVPPRSPEPVERALWAWSGALAFLTLLAASGTLTSLWTGVVHPGLDAGGRQALERLGPFIVRGAFVGALLTAGAGAAALAGRRRLLGPAGVVAALVALVVADGFRVDTAFVSTLDFHEWVRPDPNVRTILERQAGDPEPYRLLSFARRGQDVAPSIHGIELAAGHHPNDLSRYRELIGMVGSGLPENLVDPDVRRLLNVRYILWPDAELGGGVRGAPLSRTRLADGRVYQSLYADPGLPRARLVGSATVRPDSEAVAYMLSDAFDPETEVVLPEPPSIDLEGGEVRGEVAWEERTPNRLRLTVRSDRPALLVVADNWFPAWNATVDGADAPVLRAYHTLRAVPVPAGESRVVMEYRSATLTASAWTSALVLAGLLSTLALGLQRARRRRLRAGGVEVRGEGEGAVAGSGTGGAS